MILSFSDCIKLELLLSQFGVEIGTQSRLVLFGFPIGRYEVDLVSLVLDIFFAPRSITKTEVSFGECRAVG